MYLAYNHFYHSTNYLYGEPIKGSQGCRVSYRFAFNGKEMDNEVQGGGNSYDFGARIYDSRLGKWLSLDPLQDKFPYASPYNFALNKPILMVDYDGRDIIPSNQFKWSRYYDVTLNIVNSLKTNPVANKYISPFLNKGNDITLTYSSFTVDAQGDETKGAKYLATTPPSIMFNSAAIMRPVLGKEGMVQIKGEAEFFNSTQIGMAQTILHEFMHSKLGHHQMASVANRNDMKSFLKDYAVKYLKDLKLDDFDLEALSWRGLTKTDAFTTLDKTLQGKIKTRISELIYKKEQKELSEYYEEVEKTSAYDVKTDEVITPK
ncbi:MAG: RHS repeat domain-containing protein [Bacteroidia bacterium]